MVNFIFGMQINIKVFYKLVLSCWICLTRHAKSIQYKFAYVAVSAEKHGGGGGGEVNFLLVDKQKFSTS